MSRTIISVDAMGGDFGPEITIQGVAQAQAEHPQISFLLYGDEMQINAALAEHPALQAVSKVIHCDMAISMDAKPSIALRQGRKVSSMWQAIDAVKQNEAHACVSGGNTGALMAMAKIILRTLPGIERPPMAGLWPTIKGQSVVLDVGANIGATAVQYAQFAVMGAAYAHIVLGLSNAEIGMLNIGVEELKGTDEVREAAELLVRSDLNFKGFVEGDGIGRGDVDVIVTDGFTGNIASKTAEGTARQMGEYLREAMSSSVLSKIGYLFARRAFRELSVRMDPGTVNGGMFLGLNGVVVKSHGSADAKSFATAMGVAIGAAEADIINTISHNIEKMQTLVDDIWAETLD